MRPAGVAADTAGNWGFDISNLDRGCKACDDFFEFAMGGWMKANPIPPEYSTWGSFTVLLDKNQQNLRQILEWLVRAPRRLGGSNEQKIGDFYASCMDSPVDRCGRGEADRGGAGADCGDADLRLRCRRRRVRLQEQGYWGRCSGLGRGRMRRTARR